MLPDLREDTTHTTTTKDTMNILPTYLSHTLVPALHEKRIKTTDDVFRVDVRDEGKSGTFVYITLMGHGETDWEVVATPGFDGGPDERILWQINHTGGAFEKCGHVDVHWTGDVKYDTTIYLQAMRNVIIQVMERLFPAPKTRSIVVLDDGETWAGEGFFVELTEKEYERIMDGEKVCDVVPTYEDNAVVC